MKCFPSRTVLVFYTATEDHNRLTAVVHRAATKLSGVCRNYGLDFLMYIAQIA